MCLHPSVLTGPLHVMPHYNHLLMKLLALNMHHICGSIVLLLCLFDLCMAAVGQLHIWSPYSKMQSTLLTAHIPSPKQNLNFQLCPLK
uniref:Uncharacterized protein n=1 Tax=Gorilla gorilla gorilla TaxID=9595 RepID=A0A2I2ZYS9_GORGO